MKSFHVYLEPPAAVPERYVSDYPSDEQSRFRERFRPLAERYRRYRRVATWAMWPGFAFGLLFLARPSPPNPWILGPCLVSLAVCGGIAALSPLPKCPACHNRLDQGFGEFCPECGAQALERAKWLCNPKCAACARTMSRRKSGRHYRIRACTHCGVMLDENGL